MTRARAGLAAICAAELGTMLVFSSFSALLPPLKAFPPRKGARPS